jgi:hypothetical protein
VFAPWSPRTGPLGTGLSMMMLKRAVWVNNLGFMERGNFGLMILMAMATLAAIAALIKKD